jgi:predicted permease
LDRGVCGGWRGVSGLDRHAWKTSTAKRWRRWGRWIWRGSLPCRCCRLHCSWWSGRCWVRGERRRDGGKVRAGFARGGCTLAVLCVRVAGLLPRPHGLLRKENVKFMADLTFLALVPCFLVVSLGKGTNGQVLLESVSLLLWSGIQLLVGLLLGGYAFERVAKPERHFAVAFKLAATFGNQGSLPLLLLSSLMRSAAFADDPTAYQRSAVYVFVYGIVWSIALWGVGRQIAARDPHKSGAGEAGAGERRDEQGAIVVGGAGRGGGGGFLGAPAALERCWAPVLDALEAARERWEEWEADERWGGAAQSLRECGKAMRAGLLTPPVVAIAIGILVGLTPLQGALFERGGSLLPVGDVVATLGAAAIPMSNLVLAGSLFHGLRDAYERFQRRRSERRGDEERGLRNGGNASGDMEMEVEMESSSPSATSAVASSSSASSFAGVTPTANVPSSSTTSSSTTSPPSPASPTSSSSSDEAAPAQAGESISVRTIALMCVARLVLVSGVNVGLYWLASWAKVPVLAPGAALDPVMRMVILVEACMPSGQFNLLILQTTGNQKAAQDLSSAYLIMYPLSLISIAGWLTLANYIVLQWEPSRV